MKIRRSHHRKYLAILLVAIVPMFSGCCVAECLIDSMFQSEYERDIERRGPGSQKAWLEATGGNYNGNLPVD